MTPSPRVPAALQEKFDAIAQATDAFCDQRLNDEYKQLIRQALAVGIRQCVLAQTYGVSDSTVSLIARAKTWRHVQ